MIKNPSTAEKILVCPISNPFNPNLKVTVQKLLVVAEPF